MNLGPEELRLIERVRRADRKVVSVRWTRLVFAGGIWAILGFGLLPKLPVVLSDSELRSVLWPVLAPLIVFALGISAWALTLAVREWNGNAGERLLVRIVDELERIRANPPDQEKADGATPH